MALTPDDALPGPLRHAAAAAAAPGAGLADAIQAATMMLHFGFIDLARQLLEDTIRLPPAGQNALLSICRRIAAGRLLWPPSATPAGTPGGVLVAPDAAPRPNAASHDILLLFGPGSTQFWGIADPTIIRRPALSLIFLRSVLPGHFLGGIAGLGEDLPACLSALRRIAAALAGGARPRLFCIGHSSAGYAALRFGLELGARAVLATSSYTSLDPADAPTPGLQRPPDYDAVPAQFCGDLLPLYAAAPNPPRLTLIHGEGHAADAWSSRRMLALPGVTVEALAGYAGHDVMFELVRTGRLGPLIDALLADAGD